MSAEPLVFTERDLDERHLLSRQTRYRLRLKGRFPETVSMGGRRYYRAKDIFAYVADPEAWVEEHNR